MAVQGKRVVNIPGTPGLTGTAGTPGARGSNCWAVLTASFTMPALSGSGDATFDHADHLCVGQPVWVETLGTLEVTAISGAVVTLKNLQDGSGLYAFNAGPGTVAPSSSRVTPTGFQGPAGP